MTTPDSSTLGEGSNEVIPSDLPSFEALRRAGTLAGLSLEMFRLHWHLRGTVEDSIMVLEDATDYSSQQRAYQVASGPDEPTGGAARLHPVAGAPYTDPPVSAITVTIRDLDKWDEEQTKANIGRPSSQIEDGPPGAPGERRVAGDGDERPGQSRSLTIAASARAFVTIGDFVGAVHPWLVSLHADLCRAKGVDDVAPMVVYQTTPTPLNIHAATGADHPGSGMWAVWEGLANRAYRAVHPLPSIPLGSPAQQQFQQAMEGQDREPRQMTLVKHEALEHMQYHLQLLLVQNQQRVEEFRRRDEELLQGQPREEQRRRGASTAVSSGPPPVQTSGEEGSRRSGTASDLVGDFASMSLSRDPK